MSDGGGPRARKVAAVIMAGLMLAVCGGLGGGQGGGQGGGVPGTAAPAARWPELAAPATVQALLASAAAPGPSASAAASGLPVPAGRVGSGGVTPEWPVPAGPSPLPAATAPESPPRKPQERRQPREPRQDVDCRRAKCVALTFDDGPGKHTDRLLRHLAKHRALATFFVVGRAVAERPGPVGRAYAAGHEIGNHTWSHPDLTRLPAARVRSQLARTDRAVQKVTGTVPGLVRPPYGAMNKAVRRQTDRPMVMWDVDTLDWRHRDSGTVARKAIKRARPGSVILFHDIHPTTVRAVPRVLGTLAKRGYRFVTVSTLFGGKVPAVAHRAPRPAKSRAVHRPPVAVTPPAASGVTAVPAPPASPPGEDW